MVQIVENTLRDGSYVVDFQMDREQTARVVGGLDQLGFNYIEIGHGLGLGAGKRPDIGLSREDDETYIRSALAARKQAKIGVFCIPGIATLEDIDAAAELGLDFIRIGFNINRYQETLPFVERVKKHGLMVAVNLMKSYGVKGYEFTGIVREIDSWQMADIIYLVDSAGCMMPDEVYEYTSRTRDLVSTALGFHGHNNLSMAMINTVKAIEGGATFVDTCVRGMGRSAGNAQTEIAVHVLKNAGLLDLDIDLYDLYRFANEVVVPMMPRTQGMSDDEIHTGVSRFHSSYMPMVERSVEKFKVDRKRLMKAVSDVNCINPDQELFDQIAASLDA